APPTISAAPIIIPKIKRIYPSPRSSPRRIGHEGSAIVKTYGNARTGSTGGNQPGAAYFLNCDPKPSGQLRAQLIITAVGQVSCSHRKHPIEGFFGRAINDDYFFVTLGWLGGDSRCRLPPTAQSTQNMTKVRCRSIPIGVRKVVRTMGRILSTLIGLASTGFLLLVLIGLWDRHEQEITAGLSRIYERYLASQAGPSSNPRARAAVEAERAGVVGRGREVATTQTFQEQPKLVGTGAVGSANQGMSVALSADGNT